MWGFKVLRGEGGGRRNGVLSGVNHLSEVFGAGRSHEEGCRLLLVVGELLSQAMLSATGSCSQAGKHCPLPAAHLLVSCLCFGLNQPLGRGENTSGCRLFSVWFPLDSLWIFCFWHGDVWQRRWFKVVRLARRALLPCSFSISSFFPGAQFCLSSCALCLLLLPALRMSHTFPLCCCWGEVWEETSYPLR